MLLAYTAAHKVCEFLYESQSLLAETSNSRIVPFFIMIRICCTHVHSSDTDADDNDNGVAAV